jgi:hypothetical protein
MWNGLMIDMNEQSLTYVRQVTTFSDWIGQVGGFIGSVALVLGLIYPFVAPMRQLESKLISKLF